MTSRAPSKFSQNRRANLSYTIFLTTEDGNTCCCEVNTGKGNHAAREMRTFVLQVVVTRESHFRENLLTAYTDGKANDVARIKPLRAFYPCEFQTNRFQRKITNAVAHFLLQNHEYGGYGDEPRRKRWVCIHC